MAKIHYPSAGEIAEGKRRGEEERRTRPHAKDVRYVAARREFELTLLTENKLVFPVDVLSEIAGATDAQYAEARLLPSGGTLTFDSLNMDYDVPGLVMDLVVGTGWRQVMRATLAREIAATTSPAKAAAARENGKKGGRPRKNRQAS